MPAWIFYLRRAGSSRPTTVNLFDREYKVPGSSANWRIGRILHSKNAGFVTDKYVVNIYKESILRLFADEPNRENSFLMEELKWQHGLLICE
jgi:hypothetical protein